MLFTLWVSSNIFSDIIESSKSISELQEEMKPPEKRTSRK